MKNDGGKFNIQFDILGCLKVYFFAIFEIKNL